MHVRTSVIGNITWLGAASALVKPLWIVFITAFCMRLLGVEGYGQMMAALAIMTVAALLADLGLFEFTVKEVARDSRLGASMFANFFVARAVILLILIVSVTTVASSVGYGHGSAWTLGAAGCYVALRSLTEYCRAFFRAHEVLRFEAFSMVVEKVAVIFPAVVLLYVYGSAAAALAGMALGMAITLVVTWGWLSTRFVRFDGRLVRWKAVTGGLTRAFPLGLISFFGIAFLNTGVVMVEAMSGTFAAGEYGAAFRVVESLILIPAVIAAPLLPRLSNLYGQGKRASFRSSAVRMLALGLVVAICMSVFISVFSARLMLLLDPSGSFVSSAGLLAILVWAFPLMTASNIVGVILIAMERQLYVATAQAVGFACIVALCVVLIPAHGHSGAVYAFLIAQTVILCGYAASFLPKYEPPQSRPAPCTPSA